MIDVSVDEYNRVKQAIRSLCKSCGQIDTDTPPALPYLAIEQMDNPIRKDRVDCDNIENAVKPMIQIKVYTKGNDSLLSNTSIMNLADGQMIADGWLRTFGPSRIKNLLDSSILCYVARYEATVDEDKNIYSN